MKLLLIISTFLYFSNSSVFGSFVEYGFGRVDLDLEKYDSELEQMNIAFNTIPVDTKNKVWVSSKLSHMVSTDQFMRSFTNTPYTNNYTAEEKMYFQKEFSSRFSNLDKANTVELKKLLAIYGWFRISEFGEQADKNAWLLVQHADLNPQFQKRILKVLGKLFPINKTNSGNYAYLYDRVKSGEQKPQLYGTQGRCVDIGKWEPLEIEDAVNVDKRRKEMGLVSMAIYKTYFKDVCKKPEA